ncbi:hypothetical protein [Paraburkholderia dilworthii]|uniref:hypothetical protein n=1 Tax=Paraburkholderia dilworthii TaxID=948106 RepID=UPI0003FA7C10|nr:hypothetical protein [Paraburkholderia dilworthii]
MSAPVRRQHGRVTSIVCAVILFIAFAIGVKEISARSPTEWVQIHLYGKPKGATPKINIMKSLPQTLPADGMPPQALATFVKQNGQPLTVQLLTARLTDKSFDGQPDWKSVGDRLLILNSVDEAQSIDGGISGPIGTGCRLDKADRPTLNRGDVDFHECQGVYHDKFGVDTVANVAIVVWANPDSQKRPCWNAEGSDIESKYQACVKEDTSNAIVSFMDQMRNQKDVNGIIVPAVGTGTGRLAKEDFYFLFFAQISLILNDAEASKDFPRNVYLLVDPSDTAVAWGQTRNAIATSLGRIASNWQNAEHKSSIGEWAPLVGVAGGAACFLLLSGIGWFPPWMHNDAVVLQDNFSISFLLAWLASAIGLATAAKTFVVMFSTDYRTPWLEVAAGFVVVFLAGPLLRAADAVRKSTEHSS